MGERQVHRLIATLHLEIIVVVKHVSNGIAQPIQLVAVGRKYAIDTRSIATLLASIQYSHVVTTQRQTKRLNRRCGSTQLTESLAPRDTERPNQVPMRRPMRNAAIVCHSKLPIQLIAYFKWRQHLQRQLC
jgi:hypothetical protein